MRMRASAGITAVCLTMGLAACGAADEPRTSQGSEAARPKEATPISADALGGSTTTVATPAPAAPVAAQRTEAAGSAAEAIPTSESVAAKPLTPATNDQSPCAQPCYKGTVTAFALEQAIVAALNAHRDPAKPLNADAKLAFVARGWSEAQQGLGAIGHGGFPLTREAVYLAEFGAAMPYFLGAENVGTTYGTDQLTMEQLAAEVVDMWWGSRGHRANIEGDYAVIGLGVSISPDARTIMATALFAR